MRASTRAAVHRSASARVERQLSVRLVGRRRRRGEHGDLEHLLGQIVDPLEGGVAARRRDLPEKNSHSSAVLTANQGQPQSSLRRGRRARSPGRLPGRDWRTHLSSIERGTRRDDALATAYRQWLRAA